MEGAIPQPTEPPAPAGQRQFAAPLIALIAGPLGHIAIGRWRRACAWYAAGVTIAAVAMVACFTAHGRVLWAGVFVAAAVRIALVIDVARSQRVHPLPRARLVLLIGVGVAIFYEILAVKVRSQFVEAFQTPSGSMYPALDVGDHFFTRKVPRAFERGDVVTFRYPREPETQYVKRIVGVGGDTIAIADSQLFVNGRPIARRPLEESCGVVDLDDPCRFWEETLDGKTWRVALGSGAYQRSFGPTTVPPGHFFVLGDNRDNSSDSRVWGTVPGDLIVGKATFIWWSRRDGKMRWERVNEPVR